MPTQEREHVYSAEEYSRLTDEQKAALALVAENLSTDLCLEQPLTDKNLSDAFGILAPSDGCVPNGYVSDDILLSIRAKFACIFDAACETIERRWRQAGRENQLLVVLVDPSYEDATHIAVCDCKSPGRCYFHGYYKAWSYTFESLSEIADEVLTLAGHIGATEKGRP